MLKPESRPKAFNTLKLFAFFNPKSAIQNPKSCLNGIFVQALDNTLTTINVSLSSIDADIAFLAGKKWNLYRKSGGTRERIITDFLIGAHALMKAERFLTRDRGFYKSYFPELQILPL